MNAEARDLYVRMRAAIEANRPWPLEVRRWFLDGLDQWEQGSPLDAALGLNAQSGEAWRHPIRQLRRARMESLMLTAAVCTGELNSRTASRLALALQGKRFDVPGRALDFIFKLDREFRPHEVPRTRTPILKILQGDTRACRDGIVQSRVAIQSVVEFAED